MARLCTHMSIFLNENVIQKLKQRKIYTVIDLLKEDPEKLVGISELSYKEVLQVRHSIIANYSAFPHKGINMYNDLVTNSALIPTGVESLDNLLEGGFLTGNLYEVCGLSGVGKTQLCLTVATNVAHHLKQQIHYIDAKLDFSGKRVQAMLRSRSCDEEGIGTIMERIQVTRIHDVFKLFSFLHMLKDNLHHVQDGKSSVRLIIIDSLPTIFFPYLGGISNDGLSLLNQLASTMKYIAMEYHVAFLVVNLATKWIDEEMSTFTETDKTSNEPVSFETLKPALGKYWMHIPSTRLYLKKNQSEDVHISVMKSTNIKLGKFCQVTITSQGIQ